MKLIKYVFGRNHNNDINLLDRSEIDALKKLDEAMEAYRSVVRSFNPKF
jgi:hypothetical protein